VHTGKEEDLLANALQERKDLGLDGNTGELIAFVAYALAYPNGFLALVDTYDTLDSGVPNFLAVSAALHTLGYKALGIRLDSGDLAYLSRGARKLFTEVSKKLGEGSEYFVKFNIVASNDLNESTILSLNQQGHEINTYGIGTNLVTCQAQPALGGVYKLVEISGVPRIKLSEVLGKISLPGRKEAYRLYDKKKSPIFDVLVSVGLERPEPGKRILCRHPFQETKRAYVTPSMVVPLHQCYWDCGKVVGELPPLHQTRAYALEQVATLREDHVRPLNPTPYKVSVSAQLYNFIHDLWLHEAPIHEFE